MHDMFRATHDTFRAFAPSALANRPRADIGREGGPSCCLRAVAPGLWSRARAPSLCSSALPGKLSLLPIANNHNACLQLCLVPAHCPSLSEASSPINFLCTITAVAEGLLVELFSIGRWHTSLKFPYECTNHDCQLQLW